MTDTKNNKKQNKNRVNKNNDNVSKRYYVIRDGSRVSENEYDTEENASLEYSYWKNLTVKWDPTSKVSIFDKQSVKR
jgi:hypothetical protein